MTWNCAGEEMFAGLGESHSYGWIGIERQRAGGVA